MAEEEKDKSSEFNEGLLKVSRISKLQDSANYSAINGDFREWFDYISTLYREIYSKLKKEERAEVEGKLSEASQKLANFIDLQKLQRQGMRTESLGISSKDSIANILFFLDCRIRELVDSSGYGSPDAEDDMF